MSSCPRKRLRLSHDAELEKILEKATKEEDFLSSLIATYGEQKTKWFLIKEVFMNGINKSWECRDCFGFSE
jgi:hypothetical protein